MIRIHLCANCLETGAKGFPVGHEKGSQRDPYRTTHDLCELCIEALEAGRFDLFSARYNSERVVLSEDAAG